MAVCLKLAGRDSEAEALVNQNEILKAPYQRLINIKNYGEFRTALYCLKEESFNADGEIPNGSAHLISKIS